MDNTRYFIKEMYTKPTSVFGPLVSFQTRNRAANPGTVGIERMCFFVSLTKTFVSLNCCHHKIFTIEKGPTPVALTS